MISSNPQSKSRDNLICSQVLSMKRSLLQFLPLTERFTVLESNEYVKLAKCYQWLIHLNNKKKYCLKHHRYYITYHSLESIEC